MSRTARFRRLASVACLVAAPLLLLVASLAAPWYGNSDTAEILEITGDNVARVQLSNILALVAFLAMIPAALAVARCLRSGAPILGLVGGALVVAGVACGQLWIISDQFNIGMAEATALRGEFAAAMDDSSAWVIGVVLAVFLIGIILGSVVLGAGLIRARVVPLWAGVALVVSGVLLPVAHAADVQALDIVSSVLLVAAFAAVARLVLSVPDREWDGGEIAQRPSVRGASATRVEPAA